MDSLKTDLNRALALDANAVAGLLEGIFNEEMTTAPSGCASCGNEADIGTLLAFTLGPGIILRCSVCENVMIRIVQTPDALFLDARGTAFLRLNKPTG